MKRTSNVKFIKLGVLLFSILTIFALIFGLNIPQTERQTHAQTDSTFTHGQSIGRNVSGTEVSTAQELRTALLAKENIVLTNDITIINTDAYLDTFSTDTSTGYTATLYGQGYTLYVNGPNLRDVGYNYKNNNAGVSNWGAVVGTLGDGGTIFDLNVVLQTGRVAFGSNDGTVVRVGGIVGQMLTGSTIGNCTMTINSGTELMAFSDANLSNEQAFVASGGIAGLDNAGATIRNCTVINNGEITACLATTNGGDIASTTTDRGYAGNIAGVVQNNGNVTINNVVTKGTGRLYGRVVANITTNYSTTAYTIDNLYSSFEGTYEYKIDVQVTRKTHWVSWSVFLWRGTENDSTRITNYYRSSGLDTSMQSSDYHVAPTNNVVVNDDQYELSFTAKVGDTSNGLVIIASGIATNKMTSYVLTDNNSNTYQGYISGNDVIFAGLPAGCANYTNNTSGVNFAVSVATTNVSTESDLNQFEASVVTQSSTSGNPINDESDLIRIVTMGLNGYLTQDIVVTNFSSIAYSGTIDGNGHTVYVNRTLTNNLSGDSGAIVGRLNGTIKNLRVILTSNATISSTGVTQSGLICGTIGSDATIENVYVKIRNGASYQVTGTNTTNVGAVAGFVGSSNITLSDVTVELNGTLSVRGTYPFASIVIGAIEGNQTANFSNIIVKGNGTLTGDGSQTSDNREQLFASALTVLRGYQSGNSNRPTVNIAGFINAFTGTVENNGTDSMTELSMYGAIAINDAHNYWTHGNTTNITTTGYITLSNTTANYQMSGGYQNNTYVELTSYQFSQSVANYSDIAVNSYFEGGNLILVVGNGTSEYWQSGGGSALQGDGIMVDISNVAYRHQDQENYKIISVPTSIAPLQSTQTLQVTEYYIVDVDINSATSFTYNGQEQSLQEQDLVITCNDSNFGSADYSLSYNPVVDTNSSLGDNNLPQNAGTYQVTFTLLDNTYFFSDYSSAKTLSITIEKKNVSVTLNAIENAQITYGDSVDTVKNLISVTDDGFVGEFSYELTPMVNESEYSITTQAGANVTFTIEPNVTDGIDNYNITYNNDIQLSVEKKTITFNSQEKSFDYGQITQENLVAQLGDLFEGEANSETATYGAEISSASYSSDGNLKVNESGYQVVITLTDPNYQTASEELTLTLKINSTLSEQTELEDLTYGQITSENAIENLKTLLITALSLDENAEIIFENFAENSFCTGGYLKAGNYQLLATVADSGQFTEVIFEITKKIVSITITDSLSKTYDGEIATLPAISSSEIEIGDQVSLVLTSDEILGAGQYPITLQVTGDDNANYSISLDQSYSYNVQKANLTLSSSQLEATYGEITLENWQNFIKEKITLVGVKDQTFAYTLTCEAISSQEGKIQANESGYSISISASGLDNYQDFQGTITLIVNKDEVSIANTIEAIDYGDVTVANFQTYIEGLNLATLSDGTNVPYTVTCQEITSSSSIYIPANEEGYQITITVSESTNYSAKEQVLSFIVNRANVIILVSTDEDFTITYGDSPDTVNQGFTTSYEQGSFLSTPTITITAYVGETPYSTSSQAGERVSARVNIVFDENDNDDNYNITIQNEQTFIIQKQLISIDIESISAIFGEQSFNKDNINQTLTDEFELNSNITITTEFEESDFTSDGNLRYKEGGYQIDFSPINENYTLSRESGLLTIQKAQVNISISQVESASITYGDSYDQVIALATAQKQSPHEWLNLDNVQVKIVATANDNDYSATTNAGQTVVLKANVLCVDGEENYNIAVSYPNEQENITLTVQKKIISLNKTNLEIVYGNENYTKSNIVATLQSENLVDTDYSVNIDSLNFTENGNLLANESGYSLEVAIANDNYQLDANVLTIVVKKATLSFNDTQELKMSYGDTNATREHLDNFVAENIQGIVSGDELQIDITSDTLADSGYLKVGQYQVDIVITSTNNQNYNDFSTSLEFEITKKPITISLVSNSQQYTGDIITPQINSYQLVGEDDVQISLESDTPLIEIGDYTLTLVVSGQDADNYQFTLANNQFAITRATPIENDVYENITFESNDDGLKAIISIVPNADGYENATQILNTLGQLDLLKNSVGDNIAYSIVEQNVNYTQGGRLKAGTATYLATLAQGSNYTFQTFIIEINVAKIDVVVTFEDEFTFNGEQIILTPQYSVLSGDDVTVSLNAENNQPILNAGQYTIELSVSGADADSYNFTLASSTVIVNPMSVVITLTSSSITLDEFIGFGSAEGEFNPLSNVATVTDTNSQPLENVELTYNIADYDGKIEYGKQYTITISANGNYQGQTSYTLTVKDPSPAGLDTTILIIIIVCAVVALLLIILTIVLVVRHKKKKKQLVQNSNDQ